jgi:hypothetical protein
VKLAGDGDRVIGRLEVVEIRVQEGINIGTVSIQGGLDYPVKAGETLVPGDSVLGSTVLGSLKKAGAGVVTNLVVVQVLANGNAVAIKA